MSYQCGIGRGIPGLPAREPAFVCDGCGVERLVTRGAVPPEWFMKPRAKPPGWKRLAGGRTYCKQCPTPEDGGAR